MGRQLDPIDQQFSAGRKRRRAHRAERAACGRARRFYRADAAARGHRSPGGLQRARAQQRRAQFRQRALGQHRPGRRPHPPGLESQAAGQLRRQGRRQDAGVDAANLGRLAAVGGVAPDRCRGASAGSGAVGPRAFCRQPKPGAAGAAQRRLPARARRRRACCRRTAEQPGRRRHPSARPDPGGRILEDQPAREPAPPARRDRLRHAGAHRLHRAKWRQGPHGRRAYGRVGAQRLPDRQPVRPRGAGAKARPQQADPGSGLLRRKTLAQFPEHRSSCPAAGDCRLHQLQRRHERHRHRQRDLAPQRRALGPGARHHLASQRPGRSQERQCALDRAQRRDRHQGKARTRVQGSDRRTGAGAHAGLPVELRQGRGSGQEPQWPASGSERRQRWAGRSERRAHPVHAWQHRLRDADQPAVRQRHPHQARRGLTDHLPHRHSGAAGTDRGAHR